MKHGDKIKIKILRTGVEIWGEDVTKLSCREIARRMNYTHSAVLYHFGTFEKLKDEIATYAVLINYKPVVRQLEAVDHPAISSSCD